MDLTVTVQRREDGRWTKPCPKCGKIQDYLRGAYAKESARLGKACKSCSNKTTENSHRGFHHLIRLSWFTKCRISAETRGLEFCLTLDDVWFIYTMQEGRCAFSGLPIGWAAVGPDHSASIDRVDNERGYLPDNVQLVHKEINMMRGSLDPERFVELCAHVSELKSGANSGL